MARFAALALALALAAPACGTDSPASASDSDAVSTADTVADATPEPDVTTEPDVTAGPDVTVEPVAAPAGLGPHAVGHDSFTAIDSSRDDRSILVDLWYPVDPEDAKSTPVTSYPLAPLIELDSEVAAEGLPVAAAPGQTLLVFSHGYGGINTQSIALMEGLASHGFIVAAPEHTGNAQSSLTDTFDKLTQFLLLTTAFLLDEAVNEVTTHQEEEVAADEEAEEFAWPG